MIVLALGFTLFLLILVFVTVHLGGYTSAAIACILIGLPCSTLYWSLLTVLNFYLILATILACGYARAPLRIFRRAALAASGLAYLIVFLYALKVDNDGMAGLRERYPYESVADRLSYETQRKETVRRPAGSAGFASLPASADLEAVENRVSEAERAGRFFQRTNHLRQIHELHDNVVERFIESPGFGRLRGIGPDEWTIKLPEVNPVPLSPEDDYFKKGERPLPAAPEKTSSIASGESRLGAMHWNGLLDFVNPQGFGYIKDRDHVAGFQPHRFTEMPSNPKVQSIAWEVRSVELVSLLKHDPPAVYLSKNLPRMEELRKARTRPLDDFESGQLPALRRGEDLMVSATTTHMRVLGAIRAGKPCLSCHDADRGDLLGAFSYKLRREAGAPKK